MGFLLGVGTRDETSETSGSLLALKNTYLKTLKHTNETINYGMIQMSGGDMTMDYDQETTYFRGHCIEYDTVDMFQMMVDIALEPRSVMAANIAKDKNRKSHALKEHLAKFDPFAYNEETLLRTAYGYNTLGNPLLGLQGNVENIDARVMQKFMMDNITPGKSVIVANGVNNHDEFVSLAKERLGELTALPEHQYAREKAQYIGGEHREWTETPNTSITVAFKGAKWSSNLQPVGAVAAELLGTSSSATNNRANRAVGENAFVDKVNAINANFTDSGVFGLQVVGSGSHSADLMHVALDGLNSLREDISDEELNRAKNRLKIKVLQETECAGNRLEEMAKNYHLFGGELNFHQYCDKIDAVSASDINSVSFPNFNVIRLLEHFWKELQPSWSREAQSTLFQQLETFRDSLIDGQNQ